MELQDKIFHLHNQAHRLLHIECSGSYLYADDLAQLNKDIHNEMDDLKREHILSRSLELLETLPPSPLKDDLYTVCKEYMSV